MTDAPYIPQKTLDDLNAVHPEGSRHAAIQRIAMSLLGNGFAPEAIFAQIRAKFPPEKTDKEIQDVIRWCAEKNPTPSVPRNGQPPQSRGQVQIPTFQRTPVKALITDETALDLATDFIGDDKCDAEATVARSAVQIGNLENHAELLYSSLYKPEDKLNIVCLYTMREKKANPQGGGKTLLRDEWIAWFKEKGVPHSNAGAWTRPNPCVDGTGKDGAITDADITRHDYLLLESDTLPVDAQLALYAKFELPIAAILSSGGGSVHAWLRLAAPDDPTYRMWAKRVLEALAPFGFDQANKNPSRLSRLPGVVRKIGARDGGEQRLLYLNPTVHGCSDEILAAFEKQVTPPFFTRSPLRNTARAAIPRYEELVQNKDARGLPTGITKFDRDTGGLKKGQFIVLAAETNVGKSSVGLNILNRSLIDSKAVALFSLEMDRDEIFDLLLCMNLGVDRNSFNTGVFPERDLHKIAMNVGRIGKYPLYIYDNPGLSIDEIERESIALAQKVDLRLIVVDYLQLVLPPSTMRDNREQQIAFIGRSLRTLAKRCKVPLIAVSQLNEEGKIRESRAVAHDAHIVFMLEADGSNMVMRVTKGRSIQKKSYDIAFDAIHCKVYEPSPIDINDEPPQPYKD
jgi:hypothetical protein